MKVQDFLLKKQTQQKITLVTCYDYAMAKIVENTEIDCVLVGDSVSMVMHGFNDTTKATMPMMIMHTEAVARAIKTKFIVADLPFLSYRKSMADTVENVHALIQAGAHSVKLEGVPGNIQIIQHLAESGVPVMGHIGLTPQFIHHLGGYRVQGKEKQQADLLLKQAQELEQAGCFALVLECVPLELAKNISHALQIPVIGIGAGPYTDGQVLVMHDLLGLQDDISPKFVKNYLAGSNLLQQAINAYVEEVKSLAFPALTQHCYQ
jgi:3-methyl-2-oxobutanoate hydroxymethyltransferase